MSVGLALLKKMAADRISILVLIEKGIERIHFSGDEIAVYDLIKNHITTFGEVPSIRTVEAEVGVTFPSFPNEPLDYWVKGIKKRFQSQLILRGTEEARELLKDGDVDDAEARILELAASVRKTGTIRDEVFDLAALGDKVLSSHDRNQRAVGITGIPFGLPYLDAISGGAQAGDTVAIVGRPGVGKSYLALFMAMVGAWSAGFDPMVVTLEMPPIQCARRLIALRTNVNATRIRIGRLSYYGRQKVVADIGHLKGMSGGGRHFHIMAGSLSSTVEDLALRIRDIKPAILFVDGAYLLRTKVKTGARWERVSETAEILKNFANEFQIPVVSTYQFNRRGSGSLGNIGMCLHPMSIIETSEGLQRIKEAKPILEVWNGRKFAKASLVICKGKKKVFKTLLEDGSWLLSSKDHFIKVWDGLSSFVWKKVSALREGDRCIVNRSGIKKSDFPIGNVPQRSTTCSLRLRQPEQWSDGLAELVGLIIGDGWLTGNSEITIAFHKKDKDVRDKVEKLCFEIFGYPVGKWFDKKSNGCAIRLMSRWFLDFFKSLGVFQIKSPERFVPDSILCASRKIVGAFLRGLFEADGSVSISAKGMSEVRFSSFSEQLALDVQVLLRHLGIDSQILSKQDRDKSNIVRIYRSEYPMFSNRVGFLSTRKRGILKAALEKNEPKKRRGRNDWNRDFSNLLSVLSVEETEEHIGMFDLSILDEEPEFVANGILVHNSDVIGQLASIVIGIDDENPDEVLSGYDPQQFKILELLKGREGEKGIIRIEYNMQQMIIRQDMVIKGMVTEYDDD